MTEITTSQVIELADPKLRAIARRIATEAELAIEKVAANHKQPAKFPLASAPKSLETILASRFRTLPQPIQQAAATKAIGRINAPAAVRARRLGDLASIDVTKATAVDEQAKALPFPANLKLPANYVNTLANVHGQVIVPGLTPQWPVGHLRLRIHRVKCLDETDGFLGSEAGDDEIDLGGTIIDESGDVDKVAPFRVGSEFDDGEQRVYSPPKQFASFSLVEGPVKFPKSYFVTLVLAEIDMGGLPDFINNLLNWLKGKVTEALSKAGLAVITTAAGTAVGGVIGAIVGAVIGVVVGLLFDLFKSIWEDDVFKPATVSCTIPSLEARWAGKTDSPEGWIIYKGHGGRYRVDYDWQLTH